MSGVVFIAVIGAALLHAVWNAIIKGGDDKTLGIGGVGDRAFADCVERVAVRAAADT